VDVKSDMEATATPRSPDADAADAPRRTVVRVRNVVKRFNRVGGSITHAVDDVNFDLLAGEFLVLLGPSGCGKTTLLRTIAGLERPDSGTIEIDGRLCDSSDGRVHVPTERRHLGMIFQSYALWPHMTVFDNVAYPLRGRRKPSKREISDRVERVLTLVGIPELARQYPGQMSGGQQQRVALARALVAGTDLVLFDEPLSNVDARVREQLRFELATMQRELGFAAVYVTHDQSEAMGLAHRIAVMEAGKIAQIGSPREIYDAAASRYVANFVGTSNEMYGKVRSLDADGTALVETDIGAFVGTVGATDLAAGDEVVLVWRPEDGELSTDEPTSNNRLHGVVEAALFLGSHTEYSIRVGDSHFRLWRASRRQLSTGSEVWIAIDAASIRLLPS
jgi:iron(III) transport system ATP-binding protein